MIKAIRKWFDIRSIERERKRMRLLESVHGLEESTIQVFNEIAVSYQIPQYFRHEIATKEELTNKWTGGI